MYPTQVGSAPTFGFRQLLDFGIIGRSAVVNAQGRHVFVAENGAVYSLASEQGDNRLGFKEFTESMIGNDVVCSYDPDEKDVYISDAAECFVLSKVDGLAEISRLYTSIVFVSGTAYGILEDTSTDTFEVITDALNFGTSNMKTITSVEVIVTDTSTMTVALDYSMDKGQTFKRTPFVKTNQQGIAYVRAHGHDFRIVLRAADYTTIEVDDIIVKVQYDDKRNVRGLVGTERGSQFASAA
jgi:hypothetical protein